MYKSGDPDASEDPDHDVPENPDLPDNPDEVDGLPVPELHEQEGQVVEYQQTVQVAAGVLHCTHQGGQHTTSTRGPVS